MSNKLPSAFIRSLIQNYNIEGEEFIKSHESGEQLTSIRLNNFKPSSAFQEQKEIPWCPAGRYLNERPSFTADPLFHAGCYYVQEASSMFLEHVLKHTTDLNASNKVLDLCAAPGGKSTLISSLINEDSFLLSNEIIKTRVPVLTDNLTKWGPVNTFVSNNDPRDFKRLGAYFDIVVVDAPCSGSGMFRKDPDAINEWSESAVLLCSQRQQRILADIYPALLQSGTLIYSTCSYSKQENEDISDWLCDSFGLSSIQIPIEMEWGIEETLSAKHKCYGYRFYPHKVKGEGFFIAAFRKTGPSPEAQIKRAKETRINQHSESIIRNWLKPELDLRILGLQDDFFAINKEHEADLQYLQSNLYLKKSGVRLGKVMGKDLVPNHELALSLILNGSVQRIEVTREQAISYLKRDELKLETNVMGWALFCYQGHPLGWAKMLGNRMNNYFPKEIRIMNQSIT
ncbi:methyltransferase RsmF C-terminal domain-like protein [Daejeonella lutea]|uniref:16S rRNA C967 or C1407 C5-methylase, RsmB/RsmF family n=1 Tax=Daejeonella lutea TaxID=572036 RepID=A0A1T5FEN1_9SPHI|nr:RNA methyltransferase [Daejeonella lutea]SKB94621.1 16S rRNA C967 or C1407 C5-methylase, RsmB/RsmF family [Daejeonella lutea]